MLILLLDFVLRCIYIIYKDLTVVIFRGIEGDYIPNVVLDVRMCVVKDLTGIGEQFFLRICFARHIFKTIVLIHNDPHCVFDIYCNNL